MTKRAKSAGARRLGSIIVISAPSGAGKTTLVARLLASVPDLVFSVSHTTRPPRHGERNGREYYFVPRRRFERMIAQDEFIEWASVFGHLYGTSRQTVKAAQAAGKDILLDIDVQGHAQVKQRLPQSVSVFVLPPSFAELERRLRRRRLDSPQAIERRLREAREEVRHWTEFDYLVVNDRLAVAAQALKTVVMAARLRRASQEGRAGEIANTFGG